MKTKFYIAFTIAHITTYSALHSAVFPPVWGFFAHKLINRLAVFTLPPEMAGFYKKNIAYISEHAVDPDKRRYSSKHEAPRHYIDLDVYGKPPFHALPRKWLDALTCFTDIYAVDRSGDTCLLIDRRGIALEEKEIAFRLHDRLLSSKDTVRVSRKLYTDFYFRNILPKQYEDEHELPIDSFKLVFPGLAEYEHLISVEHLSEHGILPFHLQLMEKRLSAAFRSGDNGKILQLSAEIGHYLGDAHVPLHTSRNYNGQLSGQVGIHAFWESRLPELFSSEYDFWVGAAVYLPESENTYWQIVSDSHALVDSLLVMERHLSLNFPSDRIKCPEQRMGATVITQCEEYARAYHEALKGQVESRLRKAIITTGSVWMTAWVNAGQPDLSKLGIDKESINEQSVEAIESGSAIPNFMLGRPEN